jgi:SWI/SNF-related matrix-associated actin-dependent regulator 1 of chromatin subfamily A
MTPFPYQLDGAHWLAAQDRLHKLLGDEPGLGKTLQAILAAAKHTQGNGSRLVIGPAIAREVWKREIKRIDPNANVFVAYSPEQKPILQPEWMIIHYEMISTMRVGQPLWDYLNAARWDILILDEAHLLKTSDAIRTQRILGPRTDGVKGLMERCDRVWALTGTPSPNSSVELWPLMHALCPDLIMSRSMGIPMPQELFFETYSEYRETPFGRKIIKARNTTDLKQRLDQFMLRRRKKDVLPDLPPLLFDTWPIEIEALPGDDNLNMMREAERDLRAKLGASIRDPDLLDILSTLPEWSTLRRLTGAIKAPIACDIITDLLEGGVEKLIVFAHHRDVLMRMHRGIRLIKSVLVMGNTSDDNRNAAIDDFQYDRDTQVFFGQITTASTAITLHASSRVLFVEPSTVPKDNLQAASRAHRIGQKSAVLASYLMLAGSMDEIVMGLLRKKTLELCDLYDDDPTAQGLPGNKQ